MPESAAPILLLLPILLNGLGAAVYAAASYQGKAVRGVWALPVLAANLLTCLGLGVAWGWETPLQVAGDWPGVTAPFAWAGLQLRFLLVWDSLSAALLLLLHGVSLLVGVYAWREQAHRPGESRFWSLLLFFIGAMHLLLLAGNGLLLFMAWELIGLGSTLLIGHSITRRENGQASLAAFLLNRLGDAGLLIALLLVLLQSGSDALPQAGGWAPLNTLSSPYPSLIAGGVALAALAKSGQWPLGAWLPKAMVGPTPASALLHAATLVAAGAYLVLRTARYLPHNFQLLLALLGLLTALVGGWQALKSQQLKTALAYSTQSQLGLILAAAASGPLAPGAWHLLVHGSFKAGLFLVAGLLLKLTPLQRDPLQFRGLALAWPRLALVVLLLLAALAGLTGMASWLSKEALLAGLGARTAPELLVGLRVLFVLATSLTAAYSMRLAALLLTRSGAPPTVLVAETQDWLGSTDARLRWAGPLVLAISSLFLVYSLNPLDPQAAGLLQLLNRTQAEVLPVLHPGWVFASLGAIVTGVLLGYLWVKRQGVWVGARAEPERSTASLQTGAAPRYTLYGFWKAAYREGLGGAALLAQLFERRLLDGGLMRLARGVSHARFGAARVEAHALEGATLGVARLVKSFERQWQNSGLNDDGLRRTEQDLARRGRSLVELSAWLEAHLVDGAVRGLAWSIAAAGGRLRNVQSGRLQQYVLYTLGAVLLALGLVLALR